MSEQPLGLMPFYRGWDGYQQHLVAALAPLTAEQLRLEAAPHLRSIDQLARHIIAVRAGWLYYVLNEQDEPLEELSGWADRDAPVRSGAELARGLEATWQVLQDRLQRWTETDLEQVFRDVDENGQEVLVTRQWVIWHLIEHDLHHGGELSFSLGMHNLPAINL